MQFSDQTDHERANTSLGNGELIHLAIALHIPNRKIWASFIAHSKRPNHKDFRFNRITKMCNEYKNLPNVSIRHVECHKKQNVTVSRDSRDIAPGRTMYVTL